MKQWSGRLFSLSGWLAAGALAAQAAHAAPAAHAGYKCIHLEDEGAVQAGGMPYSYPAAINDDGVIVGRSNFIDGLGAAVWRRRQSAHLASPFQDGSANPLGLNNRGQAVGYSSSGVQPVTPVVWNNGVPSELAMPGLGFGMAKAINDRGHVVGDALGEATGGATHAMLWRGGRVTDLGTVPRNKGKPASFASDINEGGVVVGSSHDGNEVARAVRWPAGRNSIEALPELLPGTSSWARAVNTAGTVVGTAGYGHALGDWHAAAWKDGQVHDLGALPGHAASDASDVNDAEVIVGASQPDNAPSRAVVWYGIGSAPVDLNERVGPGGCTDTRGVVFPLTSADGINASGAIAATGQLTGWDGGPVFAAFRLVPR